MLKTINKSSTLIEQKEKPSIKDLFKNKSFMIIFTTQLVNNLAINLFFMTFSYLIFDLTKNASLMAMMGILGTLPNILTITLAGVIVDRKDQRKIIFLTTLIRLITFSAIFLIYLFRERLFSISTSLSSLPNGSIQFIYLINVLHFIWPVYLCVFLTYITFSFESLSINSYSKYIIDKKNYLVANSVNSIANQITAVISPLIAGAILSISFSYSFIIAISLAVVTAFLSFILQFLGKKPLRPEKTSQGSVKQQIVKVAQDTKVGFGVYRQEPKLLYILIIYSLFNFGVTAINGTYTAILQGEMKLTPIWLGVISSVMSAIAVITGLILMKIGKIKRKLILVNILIITEAFGLFLFAFNRNPWIMVFVITIPFGFVNGAANIPSQTLRQELVPQEKQGRVLSIAILATSSANLLGMIIMTFTVNLYDLKYFNLISAIFFSIVSIIGTAIFIKKKQLNRSDYAETIKDSNNQMGNSSENSLEDILHKKSKTQISAGK